VKQVKNVFVIMSDESDYGKRIIVDEDRAPVDKAAGQYAVSPTNQAFIKEYRTALQAFISKHRNDADPDIIQDYMAHFDDNANPTPAQINNWDDDPGIG
jgi:hypothetical protein